MGTAHRKGISHLACLAGAVACAISLAEAADDASVSDPASSTPTSLPANNPSPEVIYAQQYAAGNFAEAGDAAKLMLSEIISREGGDLAYADALEMLARAQQMGGDTASAAQNYLGAIERIEAAEDRLTTRLVGPLVGLARSLRDSGASAPAVKYFERAAHVLRVNHGPMNVAQCEILTDLVDIYAEQSSYDRAIDIQNYQLQIYRRAFSDAEPVVVDAWRRNGELLTLSGEHHDAQELYRHAMDLIRVADDHDSLAQVPLLMDLSESVLRHAAADRFTRIEMARAELERAVSITESNVMATPGQHAAAHLRLGDFYQRFGEWHTALVSYRGAWQALSADEAIHDTLVTAFGQPVLVSRTDKPSHGVDADPTAPFLTIRFDVSHRGRVENATVIDDGVDGRLARKAVAKTRKLVFRPRFQNGDPAPTRDLLRKVPVDD